MLIHTYTHDIVRTQRNDLSQKIHNTIQPVFVSQKINQHLKLREAKLPLVNQQSLVYQFKCDLCDAGYVGFSRRPYINAWTNIDTPLLLLASISVTNTLRHRKISLRILPSSKNATASLTALSMRCFLLDQVSMYNVTQFVRKFLNNIFFFIIVSFILFLYVLIVFNTPLFNIFMLFTFVTSLFYYIISTYVNFIFTLLDNDR